MYPKIILASRSPRRQELLKSLNVDFVVKIPDIEEEKKPQEGPIQFVRRIAREKAEAIECNEEDLIIAADTIVYCRDRIIGKPRDSSDAYEQLSFLSACSHEVISGLCIKGTKGEIQIAHEVSKVFFRKLSREEILAYIKSREPLDKAGSYGIQGLGALFIDRIEGCFYNVVGLPLTKLYLMLKEQGFDLLLKG